MNKDLYDVIYVHRLHCKLCNIKRVQFRGAWVAQSVKPLTSAQVMISCSWVRAPRRALCSEPGGCFGFCLPLSLALPLFARAFSLSKINTYIYIYIYIVQFSQTFSYEVTPLRLHNSRGHYSHRL